MKDTLSRLLAVLALALAASTAVLFFRESSTRPQDPVAEEIRLYLQVRELVREDYVQAVDGPELLHNALKGMVGGLDPYSRYYDTREKEELEVESSGRFVGIGVVIETSSPTLTVLFPQPGSPAEKAGLGVGDRIVAVDGVVIDDLSLEDAREKIRGEPGSEVLLRWIPASGGEAKEARLVREEMRDPTVARAALLDPERGIGYLWISSFTQETVEEFDQAVERLRRQGMKSLILDLRFNPGGVLDAAVLLVNRFLREGAIVSTRGRAPETKREHRAESEECLLEGTPLVILINGDSASASEVVAGAVQDHRLGAIVGTRSYGKGVVQTLRGLGEGKGVVKLTTSFYYTPSNRNFERALAKGRPGGIEPDLLVPISEKAEDALQRAASRYEVPEAYRGAVEAFRKKLDLAEESIRDPQLEAAIALLRDEKPSLLLR